MSDAQTHPAVLATLSKLIDHQVVHEAIIRALLSTHPDPSSVERVSKSLLAQAQGTFSLSDQGNPLQSNPLGAPALSILDSIFQPPIALPPDES